jgi:hypothetical protein
LQLCMQEWKQWQMSKISPSLFQYFLTLSKAVKKAPPNVITLGPVITDNINRMIVLIVLPLTKR